MALHLLSLRHPLQLAVGHTDGSALTQALRSQADAGSSEPQLSCGRGGGGGGGGTRGTSANFLLNFNYGDGGGGRGGRVSS